tara:strand:+ start:4386 stop:5471 length:1086 start_codon:yes stop_codon:yes gene_type:complete
MSFKDKPLKKIVADTRVTIDAIHTNKINEFKDNKGKYAKTLNEISQLKEDYRKSPDESKLHKIHELELNNLKYDPKNEVDYYLDTSLLLNEYYDQKSEVVKENKEITVLDFMNKKKEEPEQNNDIVNEYMSIIDDTILNTSSNKNIEQCPVCSGVLILKNIDSKLICEQCGFTQVIIINSEKVSYKDPPRESSYFAYKRINHFNEWLAQFQAKETTDIPEEVYKGILDELKKNKFINIKDLSYKNVREILKKLKFNKYYEHIPHIINILNGQKAPILTRHYEEQLRMMFKEIQTPFMTHCPIERKNFLSYSYVLHKFCELLELDDLLVYFPLLKSREKLQQQDQIWEKICGSLQWEYIPSI